MQIYLFSLNCTHIIQIKLFYQLPVEITTS